MRWGSAVFGASGVWIGGPAFRSSRACPQDDRRSLDVAVKARPADPGPLALRIQTSP